MLVFSVLLAQSVLLASPGSADVIINRFYGHPDAGVWMCRIRDCAGKIHSYDQRTMLPSNTSRLFQNCLSLDQFHAQRCGSPPGVNKYAPGGHIYMVRAACEVIVHGSLYRCDIGMGREGARCSCQGSQFGRVVRR